MCEDAKIESPSDTIATENHDPVQPGLNELVVKDYFPLRMHELTMAKRHESSTWRLSTILLGSKLFEGSWKLE